MTAIVERPMHSVDLTVTPVALATYDPSGSSRANAAGIAQWLWGDLRAAWCAQLADDLGAARPLTRYAPHAQQWVAAILCAAAIDAGRNARPGSWSRALTSISAASGVDRATILARHTDLVAIGLTVPTRVPAALRRSA